jgi:hypothetical protein
LLKKGKEVPSFTRKSNLGYFPFLVKVFFENFGSGGYALINVDIIRLSVNNMLQYLLILSLSGNSLCPYLFVTNWPLLC